MVIIETVFAMIMYVNGSMDGHMMTDGLSKCLKTKREAEETLDFYSSLYYALYTELDKDYKNIYEIVSNSE